MNTPEPADDNDANNPPRPTLAVHTAPAARPPRVELVDNWSDRWQDTLAFLEDLGHRDALPLDPDGWLPARHNLLVAFAGARPVAYLCFHVQPLLKDGAPALDPTNRPLTEAVVDSEAAATPTPTHRAALRHLRERAMHRALELRCARFRWERAEATAAC